MKVFQTNKLKYYKVDGDFIGNKYLAILGRDK